MDIKVVGLDIEKQVFQVHAADEHGRAVAQLRLRRSQVLEYFKTLPSCLVGMEACATAHHWARELMALGHEVRLMPPTYVKPSQGGGRRVGRGLQHREATLVAGLRHARGLRREVHCNRLARYAPPGLRMPTCCSTRPTGHTTSQDSKSCWMKVQRQVREIRRRTRVVGAFPDGQSCLNLAAARLRHIAGTQWSTKRYMNMRPLFQADENPTEAAVA